MGTPPAKPKATRYQVLHGNAPLLLVLATVTLTVPARAQEADGTAAGGGLSAAGGAFAEDGYAGGMVPGGVASPVAEAPVRLGGFLGYPYGQELYNDAPESRGYTLIPSIGVQVFATDNANGGRSRRDAEVITSITPELRGGFETVRLQGGFNYAPSLRVYGADTDDARIDHRFNGNVLTTLVPGTLFLDLRGSAAVVPVRGGLLENDNPSLSSRDSAQTMSFSATPYYLRRFSTLATALVGYTYQYGRQGGSSTRFDDTGQAFYEPQNFSSHTIFGALRSGENFGRLAMELRGNATSYSGTGVLDGASRSMAILETRYAFSRSVVGIVEGGYEKQSYDSVPPFEISEPIWGVGVRLEPGPNSSITARYRHRDGYNSPSVEGRVSLGPRTVLFASYSDSLASLAQRDADLLTTTLIDRYGNAVDSQTGGPASLGTSSSPLSLQSGLLRSRLLNLTVSQSWERDVFSVNGRREERIPIADAPGGILGRRQESTTVGLIWTHEFTPQTSGTGQVRYGWVESEGAGGRGDESGKLYSLRLSAVHRFTPLLSGSLQYLLTNRSTEYSSTGSGFDTGNSVQNAIIATLRQSF